ncbi:MAG TPA: DNA-3-methyladenine glycosylase 2 family protein [Ignisphaera sp.]|nr:DNA-3-methyladenine glycosylase 2 family protein [Ignisphaera sp.]
MSSEGCSHVEQVVISPIPPYMISPHIARFTLKDMPTPCIYNPDAKVCRRAIRWGIRGIVAYEVKIVREGWNPLINVSVYLGEKEIVEHIVKHILNTEYCYPEIDTLVNTCPGLSKVLNRYPGLRPALSPSLWGSLLKAIISQQIPMYLANRIIARLIMSIGRKFVIHGKEFYDVPTSYEIVEVGFEKLRMLGLSRRKAEYILSIAKAIVRDRYDIESLAKLDPEEAIKELCRFKGIGPWTAKLAYMATTGRLTLLLPEDKSVRKGLEIAKCRKEAVEKLREYAGLISYLASFLYEEYIEKT